MATTINGVPAKVRPSASSGLLVFFSAAFGLSWAVGGAGILLFGDVGLVLGVLAPVTVAALLTWRHARSLNPLWSQVARWRVSARWYAAAFGLPVAVIGTALALSYLATGDGAAAERFSGPAIPLVFLLFLLVIGGPEEPAWRGYALPRLQQRFDALSSSLILGAVWSLWHLPLWFLPGTPQNGSPFLWFAIISLGLCVIYTWLYNSTGASVLIVMIFHAMWNLALSWLPTTSVAWGMLAGVVTVVAVGLTLSLGSPHLSTRPRVQHTALAVEGR
jgi:uncharacterized protein